jgi:glycosyltransferase involved in cell wall biosynthesis
MTANVVRPLIIVPLDPFSDKIGGIKSFILDFVRFAPADFAIEIIGCTADEAARPVGQWRDVEIDDRSVRFLPVLATPDVHRRSRVPVSLQFTMAAMIRREAHRFMGRVLQFHHPGPPVAFLGVDAPKILTVHLNVADIAGALGESRWRRVPGALHRLEDLTLPRMDRIFLVNRAGIDFYRARHPRVVERLAFLPTSVDQQHFRPLDATERQRARRALLADLGVDPDGAGRLVLFVGRLEAQKDPLLLVETMAAAADADDQVRLLVVGEGGLRDAATKRARELGIGGRVHWVGFRGRDEMPGLMNAADAFLLPSRFEGMPISVLEALACGLPVVACAVGEVPLVVRDGANGRVVDDRTPAALAQALEWVLERPRASFAAAARSAVQPFAPAETLRPYYEAHRELHRATGGATRAGGTADRP